MLRSHGGIKIAVIWDVTPRCLETPAASIFCRRFEESAASFLYFKAGSSKGWLAPIHQTTWYHIALDRHVVLLSARINFIGLPTFVFSKYN
jgi:hypothetical protein